MDAVSKISNSFKEGIHNKELYKVETVIKLTFTVNA